MAQMVFRTLAVCFFALHSDAFTAYPGATQSTPMRTHVPHAPRSPGTSMDTSSGFNPYMPIRTAKRRAQQGKDKPEPQASVAAPPREVAKPPPRQVHKPAKSAPQITRASIVDTPVRQRRAEPVEMSPIEMVKAPPKRTYNDNTPPCLIKVVGVGGGGGNTVNRVIDCIIDNERCLEAVAINTDQQALAQSNAGSTINIGPRISRGLGAGGNPAVGEKAAEASAEEITEVVQNTDMVFVTAGMGGGTGSGAAPVVAELAKQAGCLTVGIVTKPFKFEGARRARQAEQSIENLSKKVDIMIVVENDRLLDICEGKDVPLEQAFAMADDILRQGILGISDMVLRPGLINVDFADLRSIMENAGTAIMGMGRASGKNRAVEAAMSAVSSPLLGFPIQSARSIVFTVTGSSKMSLAEVNEVAEVIGDIVSPDSNIIFGTTVDESFADDVGVTVVATNFETDEERAERAAQDSKSRFAWKVPTPELKHLKVDEGSQQQQGRVRSLLSRGWRKLRGA